MMELMTPAWMIAAIQLLGLPGLIFIIWHFDNKRLEKERSAWLRESAEKEGVRQKELESVLGQYREDVSAIRKLYESNVRLVDESLCREKRQETVYSEVLSVVSLNIEAMTRLVKSIDNNRFCPIVREKTG